MPHEDAKGKSTLSLLQRLSKDARSWMAAEAALAQAEVTSDGRRIIFVVALVALAFACVLSSVILLCIFGVALLAPYLGGLAPAAGVLSLSLIIVTGLIGWRLWKLASQEFGILAVFKRWWNIAANGPGEKHDAK